MSCVHDFATLCDILLEASPGSDKLVCHHTLRMQRGIPVKCGVNLINFGPGARPDSLMQWAILTETLGYHLGAPLQH